MRTTKKSGAVEIAKSICNSNIFIIYYTGSIALCCNYFIGAFNRQLFDSNKSQNEILSSLDERNANIPNKPAIPANAHSSPSPAVIDVLSAIVPRIKGAKM